MKCQKHFISNCLQIGDNDIDGRKFNGHALHFLLNNKKVDAIHFVAKKKSHDAKTFLVDNFSSKSFFNSLTNNKLFANSDLLHLHLVHNTEFDIAHFPFLASLKPIVWTIHDPWALGGRCVYHGDCTKWQSHCHDCPHLDVPFAIPYDNTALQFEIKKDAIQRSHIHAIVASQWMYDKIKRSPIWAGKPVHLVPFGIDQELFAPKDAAAGKAKLGIAPDRLVLFARTQRYFKGLDVLRIAIEKIAAERPLTLLTVGENGLLSDLPKAVSHQEYGWIKDDAKLIQLYQACDLFLMPSEQETFGMMAIEAMSCGKVVLALDVATSALPAVINAPHCGVAVAKDAYADELCRLINAPDELARRAELCLAYAHEQYNLDMYINRILAVYKQAMDEFVLTDSAKLMLEQLQKYAPNAPLTRDVSGASRLGRLKCYCLQHGVWQTIKKVFEKVLCRLLRAA